jgi:hypothetical protein
MPSRMTVERERVPCTAVLAWTTTGVRWRAIVPHPRLHRRKRSARTAALRGLTSRADCLLKRNLAPRSHWTVFLAEREFEPPVG